MRKTEAQGNELSSSGFLSPWGWDSTSQFPSCPASLLSFHHTAPFSKDFIQLRFFLSVLPSFFPLSLPPFPPPSLSSFSPFLPPSLPLSFLPSSFPSFLPFFLVKESSGREVAVRPVTHIAFSSDPGFGRDLRQGHTTETRWHGWTPLSCPHSQGSAGHSSPDLSKLL